MNDFISFGAWIKQRRSALDLTQWDLAERVGCSREAIQKIETGTRRPSKQIAECSARASKSHRKNAPPLCAGRDWDPIDQALEMLRMMLSS